MTPADILRLRLENQRIAHPTFKKPADVVAWFGAVQAQDYLGSLWAMGLRMQRIAEAGVEKAIDDRSIIRTWPMRGTLHFVASADARWMLQLLTPRVIARNANRLKKEVDVDAAVVSKSRDVVTRALEGGKRLARNVMYEALEAARIKTGNMRGLHILFWLAQEGTVCLAGREGKQHTFALLDEWAPKSTRLEREEALAELARRYFTSHGPATVQDFTWWAGVVVKDAQAGIEGAKRHLACERVADRDYWMSSRQPVARVHEANTISLLPAYDEYTVAYKDRSLLGSTLLSPVVIVDGRIAGTWKRTLAKDSVVIETRLTPRADQTALAAAAKRYGEFVGLNAQLR